MSSEKKAFASFYKLACMDVLARTGYQMGKSPLLPIFAASIGARPEEIGWVIGLSVLAGLISKPLIGLFSDRIGRKPMLLIGTFFFALVPFLYHFVTTPGQLFPLRFLHGFATAIYGPVMAAMVADIFHNTSQRARAFGWYDFFRSTGYVLGPFLGGLALTFYSEARTVYLLVGVTGVLAIIPAVLLPSEEKKTGVTARPSGKSSVKQVLRSVFSSPELKRAICVEMLAHMAIRMIKPFWTIYAVVTLSPSVVGLVLSVIFAVSLFMKPVTGMLVARFGHPLALISGALLVGVGTPLLFVSTNSMVMVFVSAVILGIGDGLIMPAVLHLFSQISPEDSRGLTMGVLGSCRNFGKAAGPILAGYLVAYYNELTAACTFGVFLILMSFYLISSGRKNMAGSYGV